MAKFEMMVPFILHWEEGLPISYLTMPLDKMYAKAKSKGVHIDRDDPGGYTLCGVTLATYREYRRRMGRYVTTAADLQQMPYFDWEQVLKSMYWDRWKADEIKSPMIACAVVDWVWGSGVHGITNVQKLLGVKADGIVGPKTLAALNSYPNQKALFDKIQSARNSYHYSLCYKGPNRTLPTKLSKNYRGWRNRVAMITWEGFAYK